MQLLRSNGLLATLLLATMSMVAPAATQENPDRPERVKALIIGVADYRKPTIDLPRAANDADGVAQILRQKLGITNTDILKDKPSRASILAAWRKHLKRLKRNDVSIFFFSGHGAEQNRDSYLLPSDFDASRSAVQGGIALSALIDELKRLDKNVLGIFIVDMCRRDTGPAAGEKNIESSSSYAPVRASEGMFVFYAASPGQVALHDLGRGDENTSHSVYTRELLPLLAERHRGLHDIAKDVRWTTYKTALRRRSRDGLETPHLQVPAYFDEVLKRTNILGTPLKSDPARKIDLKSTPGALAGTKGIEWSCQHCPELVHLDQPRDEQPVRDGMRTAKMSKRIAMGRFEITRDEWRLCQSVEVEGKRCPTIDTDIIEGDRRPMTGVAWSDAKAYVEWLNALPGQKRFRLPTEAEWEYAARGGGNPVFGPATDASRLCEFANGADASLKSMLWVNVQCDDGKARGTTSVGSYRPNGFDLYDMQGNVWEWVCADADAPESSARADHADCVQPAVKGGSWRSGPDSLRIGAVQILNANERRRTVGFRVVRDLD